MWITKTFQKTKRNILVCGDRIQWRWRSVNQKTEIFHFLETAIFGVHAFQIEMGNSHNNGYTGTLQSDRHLEGNQNIDTESLRKTLRVRHWPGFVFWTGSGKENNTRSHSVVAVSRSRYLFPSPWKNNVHAQDFFWAERDELRTALWSHGGRPTHIQLPPKGWPPPHTHTGWPDTCTWGYNPRVRVTDPPHSWPL